MDITCTHAICPKKEYGGDCLCGDEAITSNDLLCAENLKDQRDLLGEVLGRILIAHGVVNPMPLTGPELLMAALGYADLLEAEGTQNGQ